MKTRLLLFVVVLVIRTQVPEEEVVFAEHLIRERNANHRPPYANEDTDIDFLVVEQIECHCRNERREDGNSFLYHWFELLSHWL